MSDMDELMKLRDASMAANDAYMRALDVERDEFVREMLPMYRRAQVPGLDWYDVGEKVRGLIFRQESEE